MNDRFTLAVTGQSLIKHDIRSLGAPAFDEVRQLLHHADFSFTNFEGTILGSHGGWPLKGSFFALQRRRRSRCFAGNRFRRAFAFQQSRLRPWPVRCAFNPRRGGEARLSPCRPWPQPERGVAGRKRDDPGKICCHRRDGWRARSRFHICGQCRQKSTGKARCQQAWSVTDHRARSQSL